MTAAATTARAEDSADFRRTSRRRFRSLSHRRRNLPRPTSRFNTVRRDYFLFLKDLVRLEENEENEEIKNEFLRLSPMERQTRGKALLDLVLEEKHYSPAEHALATFRLSPPRPLPLFTLEEGDIVALVPAHPLSGDFPTGTVYEKSPETITVAFNSELPEWVESGPLYQLHKSLNRVTYKRMLDALDAVEETSNTRLAFFRDISLGVKKARVDELPKELRWFDDGLNDSQRLSVMKSLAAKDVALVHGPPGTGKTTALIEFIRQSLKLGQSVFVAAPSNTACDNVLERLVACGVNALRLGHPARISAPLREHTLDFKLALHPSARLAAEKQVELSKLMKKEKRYRERRHAGDDIERQTREEINALKSEIRGLKKEVFSRVMSEAEVIVGTLAGVQDRAVREKEFDLLVIDEATQATEPLTWVPITRSGKVVMAGDHFQLPPTVRSKEADEKGLGVTLFERFYDVLGEESKTLLELQYRMNEKIMGFSSKMFYQEKLVAHESVKEQTLAGLPGVLNSAETREMLLFIDTVGKEFEERLEEGSESRYNPEEAQLVIAQLTKMLEAGVPASQIAVISPYSAQVRLLSSQAAQTAVEIDSVDGFQGREKELVIVSLVRSNLAGELGFLGDTRRMNVAMTRARRKLIVIGDGGTLSSLRFYKEFIRYAESVGGYKTAWEL